MDLLFFLVGFILGGGGIFFAVFGYLVLQLWKHLLS